MLVPSSNAGFCNPYPVLVSYRLSVLIHLLDELLTADVTMPLKTPHGWEVAMREVLAFAVYVVPFASVSVLLLIVGGVTVLSEDTVHGSSVTDRVRLLTAVPMVLLAEMLNVYVAPLNLPATISLDPNTDAERIGSVKRVYVVPYVK